MLFRSRRYYVPIKAVVDEDLVVRVRSYLYIYVMKSVVVLFQLRSTLSAKGGV